MAVTKQKRSYINQPIGVTRFETGETQMWEAVANTAGRLNEIALKEGAKRAEQSGLDAAMAVEQSEIIAFDAETGKPKALDPSLFSGGIIAKDAYKRVVEQRFGESIENELKLKAQELQLKYEFEPELFREEMSRYVADMHKNAQGKWKETVKVGGVAITRATELFIQEKKIKFENEKLRNDINKLNTNFLLEEIYNNYNVYGDKALTMNNTHFDYLFQKTKDAEDAQIAPIGTTETFKQNYILAIGTLELQNSLSKKFIKIDSNNIARSNLITAIKSGNSISLPKDSIEKKVYEEIYSLSNGNRALMEKIAINSTDIMKQINKNSDLNSENIALKTFGFSAQLIQDGVEINNNFSTLDNDEFSNILSEQIKIFQNFKLTEKKFNLNINISDKQKIKSKENTKEFGQNLITSLIQKLIIDTSGLKSRDRKIQTIRSIINRTEDVNNIKWLDKTQKNILKNILDNNLEQYANIQKFFSNELDRISNINKNKLKDELSLAKELTIKIPSELFGKSFEESEDIINTHLLKYEKEGSLSNVGLTVDAVFYKAKLTTALAVKSLQEIQLSKGAEGVKEITAAQNYIKSGGTDNSLNNYLNLKQIIDRTINIGLDPKTIDPFLNHYKVIKNSEFAQEKEIIKNNKTHAQMMEGQRNQNTKKLSESIIDNKLEEHNITITEAFTDPMGIDNFSNVFSTIGYLIENNQKPPQLDGVVNNLFTGKYSNEETASVFNKLEILHNKQDSESGRSLALLQKILDKEQYAKFHFMSKLSKVEGLQNAKEFLVVYQEMQKDSGWQDKYKKDIGETVDWLTANGFKEAANDINSIAIIEPFLKLSFFKDQDNENLIKNVEEIFNDIYVETIDRVVTDGALGGERSFAAFSKVFPNIEVRNTVYEAIENELPPNSTLGTRGSKIIETISQPISGPRGELLISEGEREYRETEDLREFTLIPIVRGDNDYIYVLYERTNRGLEMYRPLKYDEFDPTAAPTRKAIAFGSNEPYIINKKAEVYAELNYLKEKEIDFIIESRKKLAEESKTIIPTVPEIISGFKKSPKVVDELLGSVDEWVIETGENIFNFMNKKRTFENAPFELNNDN